MRKSKSSRRVWLTGGAYAALCWASPAAAQVAPGPTTPEAATRTGAATPVQDAGISGEQDGEAGAEILVTGSRIRRDPNDSSLPLQIVTTQELERNAISNPEQFVAFLTTNGTGSDNLASNADVVSGQQRGNNGASFANLRGQGAGATLVLLNGRRVAAHGLNGAAVDVNQIPFAAIERVEVLKDGASAIYGTDAIGGVINFITRKDYRGLGLNGFVDVTDEGDSPIYRLSGVAGYGDLREQGFNVMATVSKSWVAGLRGDRRDFVDTFQPERGLSPDTRGTPFGTIFPLNAGRNAPAGTLFGGTTGAALAPFLPGGATIRASGGVNVLDLPGGEGCASNPGQEPYDDSLWAAPTARFACAWDTGRAAVLQQPLETLTYLARGVVRLGGHELFMEGTGSDATATKRFSNLQLIPNTTTQNFVYPRNAITAPTYDAVYNRLLAQFPAISARYGLPIAYRWRCVECGPREIVTDTETFRVAGGADGPIAAGWDYRVGASYSQSESRSVLGSGYYYRGTLASGAPDGSPTAPGAGAPGLIGLLNSGLLNPFLFPGQSQSPAALAGLEAVSAEGVVLYGGRYSLLQVDGSVSGRLFALPGGDVRIAVGLDYRKEKYRFNGDVRDAASRPFIIAAPFDDLNALAGVSREIKAAYAEVLAPILPRLEISGAVRVDDYGDFGSTTNPKVSAKFEPTDWLLFRASYNTGFRVPTFNQIFNGQVEQIYGGNDFADPAVCPGGVVSATNPACAALRPDILSGGNPNLEPETSEEYGAGVVFQPSRRFSLALDYWNIARENTVISPTLRQLVDNYSLVEDRFVREAGTIVLIDQTLLNAGSSRTEGMEVAVRAAFDAAPGATLTAGLDGTYLFSRRERVIAGAPYADQLGQFTFSGDLFLRWKHNAFVAYTTDDWGVSLTQIFRKGYRNQRLPGVANGTIDPPADVDRVDDYVIYNLSAYLDLTDRFRLTAGVKNLFDTDPPFAISYDANTGGGSSWEPRVADPRGRAFTLAAEVRF